MKEIPFPEIPLEDDFNDVIGKAQRGLEIDNDTLAEKAGISKEQVAAIEEGKFDADAVRKIAPVLQLGADALVTLGRGVWYPRLPDPLSGFAMINTPYEDMTVNTYVAWDPVSRDALIFDTGGDCQPVLDLVEKENLNVRKILLTHTHVDHVADLDKLVKATNAPVFVHELEAFDGAETFQEGKKFTAGELSVGTLLTTGHARGGITYVIAGLEVPVAVTGDSIFCGSMGGGQISFQDALANNRKKVLTLPDHTILCPGHGPATTVEQEKQHNPFFPEFQG